MAHALYHKLGFAFALALLYCTDLVLSVFTLKQIVVAVLFFCRAFGVGRRECLLRLDKAVCMLGGKCGGFRHRPVLRGFCQCRLIDRGDIRHS